MADKGKSPDKTPPAKRQRTALSPDSFSTAVARPSPMKAANGGGMMIPDVGTQWQMKATEFYVSVLQQSERLMHGILDEETAKKAADAVRSLKLVTATRNKMTPDQFRVKADKLLSLLQRLEFEQPPVLHPPKKKEKGATQENHVDHLSPKRINELNRHFPSTVQAGNLQSVHLKLSTPELGKGQAIPLCLPNDMQWDSKRNKCKRLLDVARSTLNLNPSAMEILKSISGPVCIVCIVGPCRSGKSYVLSRLISSVGETKCHFDLGHEMDPKTMGIWMWDQPFKVKLKDYPEEEVTMILLDTEGIGAVNASNQGDSQIFTLSVLLSSLLIYNSMTVPRREDLNQMHFVANLSKSIQVQAGEFASATCKVANSNPRFMWLLRDVILIPTDKDNQPCHIKDHLLQKVLVEDAADDEAQTEIRRCLLGFFNSFDAESLPPPSTDPQVMQNIDNPLYQKDISSFFLKQLAYVKKRIYDNCYPKKGYGGDSVISGFQLAHMVQLYVDALNSPGGIPVIGSTWQRVLEATYTEGVEQAVRCYKESMEGVLKKLPLETDDLLSSWHRKGVDQSLKVFKKATSLDSESDSELYQSFLDKLMTRLAVFDDVTGECTGGELAHYLEKNWAASKTTCQTLIRKLKKHHFDPLIKNLNSSTDFQTIEVAFMKVITEYNSGSIGPCADEILNAFISEREVQCTQLESQLSQIKNYDAEAKARMKELKEKQLKFDQKETELLQKMEQSKQDQEAKIQLMSEKHAKDTENLRKQSDKEIEEHEKRLKNMVEANMKLEELKDENAQELIRIRNKFELQERQLKFNYERKLQSEQFQISLKQCEINRLQQLINDHRCPACFIAGTTVTLSNGSKLSIEKQAEGVKILAMGGETSTITAEYVDHTLKPQDKIFSFNDDAPFAALHHPFWTTEGWKCLDPDTAKEENPDVDFKLLQVGDIVFRVAQTDPLLYEPVKVCRFNFTTLTEPTKIYGLHLDGPRSYHANGYIVAANYPVLTKKRVRDGMKKLTEEERESLKSALTSAKHELKTVLGSWAEDAFIDMGLTTQ